MSLIKNIKNKVQCMYFLSKYKIFGSINDFTNQDSFNRYSILLNKKPIIHFGFPYNNIEGYACYIHYYDDNNKYISDYFDLISQDGSYTESYTKNDFDCENILVFLKEIINYKIKSI